jgi:hypothetical protein
MPDGVDIRRLRKEMNSLRTIAEIFQILSFMMAESGNQFGL